MRGEGRSVLVCPVFPCLCVGDGVCVCGVCVCKDVCVSRYKGGVGLECVQTLMYVQVRVWLCICMRECVGVGLCVCTCVVSIL